VRQLTFNAVIDEFPDWSPDGRLIAFHGERMPPGATDVNIEVLTMRANGGEQTRLTFDDAFDGLPVWSPDGRQLAFSSERDVNNGAVNSEVYTMRADGSHQVNRTNNPAFDIAPDWQPLDDAHHDEGDD
jgi:Tol biopolymer transport system component